MDFSKVRALRIPEGEVASISINSIIVWQKIPKYAVMKYNAVVNTIYGDWERIESSTYQPVSGLKATYDISVSTNYSFSSSNGWYSTENLVVPYNGAQGYFSVGPNIVYTYELESDSNGVATYTWYPIEAAEQKAIGTSYSLGSEIGMFKLTAEEIKAIKNNAIYNNHENDKYIYYVNESGTYFAYVISEEVYNLIFNPAVVTEGTITCDYTTDSSFGPDYAQGFRITEFTPSGEEVNQDPSWKGYTVGNTIHIFCEDGVADISKYVIEWRMYNADQTSYTVFARNDYEATFIMPAYDVRIKVKVIYQSTPEHTSHNYTIPVGSRDASCTEQAYVIYKCDSCEDTYTEWGEGPLGHDWSINDGVCARCFETCSHNMVNGECTICGYKEQPTECTHVL
jgi:hypothetical protein